MPGASMLAPLRSFKVNAHGLPRSCVPLSMRASSRSFCCQLHDSSRRSRIRGGLGVTCQSKFYHVHSVSEPHVRSSASKLDHQHQPRGLFVFQKSRRFRLRVETKAVAAAAPAAAAALSAVTPEAIFSLATSFTLLYYATVICAARIWKPRRTQAFLTVYSLLMATGLAVSLAAAGFTPANALAFLGGGGSFPPSLDAWVSLFHENRPAVAVSWVLLMGADAVVATVIALDAIRDHVPCAHSIGLCLFFGPTARLCHGLTLWATGVLRKLGLTRARVASAPPAPSTKEPRPGQASAAAAAAIRSRAKAAKVFVE
ncbi:hypothetical protein PPROV_000563100 [Pycnococcus provasolii]|uniref:Uncharacterized protein n=1 Tax=Pycnococcus provasolii TaxID=41880 RepID=A0A830HPE2_9CHLO|nr:hypothetical protein PPROV_000563100 [Pycnococcus provasolii]